MASQQECERLQGELQQVLLQLDSHVRWGNIIKCAPANKFTHFPAYLKQPKTQREVTFSVANFSSSNQEVQRKADSAQDQAASGQAGLSQGDCAEGPRHPKAGERPGPGLQRLTQGHTPCGVAVGVPLLLKTKMSVPDRICLLMYLSILLLLTPRRRRGSKQ